jgi:hypothetical protein
LSDRDISGTIEGMNNKNIGFWTGIVVLVVVAGVLVWYMASHPAPQPAGTSATGQNAPGSIHENQPYYTIDAVYPTATPLAKTAGATADANARATMQSFVESTIADFKNQNVDGLTEADAQTMGLGAGRQYALDIEYVSTSTAKTTSYIFTIYQDTLGAHPNGDYQTFTFDNASGNQLTISGLFMSGSKFLNRLSMMARQSLPQTIANDEQTDASQVDTSMIDAGTEPVLDNFSEFYLANGQLVLIFPPYQVGPYALGTVLFPIPLSQIADILEPAYR